MLPEVKLDESDFEQLLREYRNMIPAIYGGWTNFNASDPGVTLLELLVWLHDNQSYTLDHLSDAERDVLLALCGMRRQDATCARTRILPAVERPLFVKRDTAFYADCICFETTEDRLIGPDTLQALVSSDGDIVRTDRLDSFGELRFEPFGPCPRRHDRFCFRLSSPLEANVTYRLYVEVGHVGDDRPRTPLREGFSPVADLAIDIDGEPVNEVQDGTHGLTESGEIVFRISDDQQAYLRTAGKGRVIGATLVAGGYEAAPVITGASMSMLELEQRETLSAMEIVTAQPGSDGTLRIRLSGRRFDTGVIELYRVLPDGNLSEISGYERSSAPEDPACCEVAFKLEDVQPRAAGDIVVLATASSAPFLEQRTLGYAKGYDNQVFSLPVAQCDAQRIAIISHQDYTDRCLLWRRIPSLSDAGPHDTVFEYDGARGEVRFGDGIHGRMPEGLLTLASFATTEGDAGNIRGNLARENELGIAIAYQAPALGGRDAESFSDALGRVLTEPLPRRAVTKADYLALVHATPGLIVEAAAVLDDQEVAQLLGHPEPNSIGIVLKPYRAPFIPASGGEYFDRAYRPNIMRFLDAYRMVNTRLRVFCAREIPLDVHIDLALNGSGEAHRDRIEAALSAWFEKRGLEFGGLIRRTDILEVLAEISCVRAVFTVAIEARGLEVTRTGDGSLAIPLDGSVILHDLRISIRK